MTRKAFRRYDGDIYDTLVAEGRGVEEVLHTGVY